MSSTTISLRDRRQITLPADIVSAAGLSTNDTLEVSLVNGTIMLVPTHASKAPLRSMSRFLGAAKGVHGNSADEVNAHIREERDSW